MDYGAMRRVPVDPRVVRKIQRSPQMMREQGAGFMSGWGGPNMYRQLASYPVKARLTYAAILDGTTDKSQIEVVTGLTTREVDDGLDWLQKKGLVQVEAEVIE